METVSAGPTTELMRKAMDHFKIPHIGVNNDGYEIPQDDEKFREMMSMLTGEILAFYVAETMVLPSNLGRLREVLTEMAGVTGISTEEGDMIQSWMDTIESVVGNLDPTNKVR